MKLSTIYACLKGTKPVAELKDEIKSEVEEYQKNIKKKGASTPITVIEDIEISFGKNDILALADSFLSHDLTISEIGYIADGLLLSESVFFEDENTKEALGELTDPEVNGAITEASVEEIVRKFS